jgi:seryl-tRNA synthetase
MGLSQIWERFLLEVSAGRRREQQYQRELRGLREREREEGPRRENERMQAELERLRIENERKQAALERLQNECLAILPEFQRRVLPNQSFGEEDDDQKTFMREATSKLPRFELPTEWESMADRVADLMRARDVASAKAGLNTDPWGLPESQAVTEFGKHIGSTGGAYLMVLVAHRAHIKHGVSVRFLEFLWHDICGWQR